MACRSKVCISCNEEKPYKDFAKQGRKRKNICKACANAKSLAKRHAAKQYAVDALGGECAHCGLKTDILAVYDFHHEDPSTKESNIGSLIYRSATKKELDRELKKCILLCRNCHAELHYAAGYPPDEE